MNPDGLIHRRREDLHRDSDRMDGRQDGGECQVETGRQHHCPRDRQHSHVHGPYCQSQQGGPGLDSAQVEGVCPCTDR